MASRLFLAIVGVAYVLLAMWCVISPRTTAASVGFELKPGSGESEYLTVYGGLQFGLGLFFLWPLYQRTFTETVLLCCLCLHGAIVCFRTASFLRYSGISSTTFILSGIEWIILLGTLWLYFGRRGIDVVS